MGNDVIIGRTLSRFGVFAPGAAVISAFMSKGVPEGEPVVLDVAQLEALLSKTFGIGLDVGRGSPGHAA